MSRSRTAGRGSSRHATALRASPRSAGRPEPRSHNPERPRLRRRFPMSTFDNAVRVLFDCFPRFDLTVEQVETWRAVLADCAPDALSAAAVQLARESDYPP